MECVHKAPPYSHLPPFSAPFGKRELLFVERRLRPIKPPGCSPFPGGPAPQVTNANNPISAERRRRVGMGLLSEEAQQVFP